MPDPDYRALCAELLDELELWSSWHDATDLKDRAAAALHFGQPEPQPPAAIVEMVNKLHQINNPAIQSVAPTDEELISPIMWMIDECVYDNDKGEIAQSLRELITRWGTPANNTGGTH